MLTPDVIVPDAVNPQSYNRYSYVENRPLNFSDPTGHCADYGDQYEDYDCWQQYNALFNQFLLNNYTEEYILGLIGTGRDYRLQELGPTGIIGLYDSFKNCGSDLDCSNNTPQTYDPYANPCEWQQWQNCYEPVVTREEMSPDAVIFPGVSASVAGIGYWVAGEEVLWNRKSGEVDLFGYTGQGAGAAFEGDVAVYTGLVWNLEENVQYEGWFTTLTVELSVIEGVQLSFFWDADSTPFTGKTWGFSIGRARGLGAGVSIVETDFVCQTQC